MAEDDAGNPEEKTNSRTEAASSAGDRVPQKLLEESSGSSSEAQAPWRKEA